MGELRGRKKSKEYLFFLMGLSLAMIQIVDIVKIAQKD